MTATAKDKQLARADQTEALLASMTLREKLGQCVMIEPCFCLDERMSEEYGESYSGILDPAFLEKLFDEYSIGAILFGGASQVGDGSPAAWAGYIAEVNDYVGKTGKGIPLLIGNDAVHGVNFIKGSTFYSHNLGLAATWNPDLAGKYAELVGAELAAIGFNCNFAPTIDVARDARWGRVYETLGEDPYLASLFASALVEGMQKTDGLGACAKHFIGYSQSIDGMDRHPADLSDRNIVETHAPPFEAAINSGVTSIMVSGNDVNGMPVPASQRLLKDLLRDKMGFQGVTMSDWEDIERLQGRHRIAATRKDAIARAFNAGLDLNMAVADFEVVDTMEELVREGRIPIDRVDEAARNILNMKADLGLFEAPPLKVAAAGALTGSHESRKVAGDIARESVTLLKNEGDILPLSSNTGSILVTGAAADSKRHLTAGWTLGWAGADENDLDCPTVLDAIRDTATGTVTYAATPEALAVADINADDFDVCIHVLSEEPHAEWLGDTADLSPEAEEARMLDAAAVTGIPVVLVSLLGRPLDIRVADDQATAILWAWSPGTEGAAAITDVLFGKFNPCGKLPLTFPTDALQTPVFYNTRAYHCDEVNAAPSGLYPFGHGLSYTTFEYGDLRVPASVKTGNGMDVFVTVENTGGVEGAEIVQLYLADQYASVTRPVKSLKAFERVTLAPGEKRQVKLSLSPKELSLHDEYLKLVEEARRIEVQVGGLSAQFDLNEA